MSLVYTSELFFFILSTQSILSNNNHCNGFTLILSDHLKDCTVTSHLVSNILRLTSYSSLRLALILSNVAQWSGERDWITKLGPHGTLDTASRVCQGVWKVRECKKWWLTHSANDFIKYLLDSDVWWWLLDIVCSQNCWQTALHTSTLHTHTH